MIDALFAVAAWSFLFNAFLKQPWGKGDAAALPSTTKAAALATLFTVLAIGVAAAKFHH